MLHVEAPRFSSSVEGAGVNPLPNVLIDDVGTGILGDGGVVAVPFTAGLIGQTGTGGNHALIGIGRGERHIEPAAGNIHRSSVCNKRIVVVIVIVDRYFAAMQYGGGSGGILATVIARLHEIIRIAAGGRDGFIHRHLIHRNNRLQHDDFAS